MVDIHLVCSESQVEDAQKQLTRLLGHAAYSVQSLHVDGTGPQALFWQGTPAVVSIENRERLATLLQNNIALLRLAIVDDRWSSTWPCP